MVLLTTPVDTRGSLYATWVGRESFDVDYVAEGYGAVPGAAIDWANKMMKPVTNYFTTYRRLWEAVLEGEARRDAYQPMASWIADNPPFPARAYRDWITWMYKENRLVRGRMWLRGERVDLSRIDAEPADRHRRRRPHRAGAKARARCSGSSRARMSRGLTDRAATSA